MKIKNLLLILFIFICSSMAWAAPINPQEAKYITNQWFSTYAPGKFLYSDIKTLTPLQSGEQTVLYIINLEKGGWSYEKTGFLSSLFYVKIDSILVNPGGQ